MKRFLTGDHGREARVGPFLAVRVDKLAVVDCGLVGDPREALWEPAGLAKYPRHEQRLFIIILVLRIVHSDVVVNAVNPIDVMCD